MRRATAAPQVDISFPEIEKFDHLPEPRADGVTAFVSIMEGCSKVLLVLRRALYARRGNQPAVRRRCSPKSPQLAEQGVREINLLGQNVNAYRGAMHDGAIADLAVLIHAIAEIRWHRPHPLHDLASARVFRLADRGAIANVPQAGQLSCTCRCSRVRIASSRAMKRGYTALEFKQKIRKLREVRPDICDLAPDFIVGFPGETDARFRADHEADRRHRLRSEFLLHLLASPRARRPRTCRTKQADASSANAWRVCRRRSTRNAKRIAEAMVGGVRTCSSRRRASATRDELAGRTENMRYVNFTGPASLIGPIRRRAHHARR